MAVEGKKEKKKKTTQKPSVEEEGYIVKC